MSKTYRLSTDSDSFGKILSEETPKSNHHGHMDNIGFQHNNAAGNLPLYSAVGYFERSNSNFNDNFQIQHQPAIIPFMKRTDPTQQSNGMRFNTDDCSKYLTSDILDLPYPSDMPRIYFTQDRQYESEYERNSNVLNSQHDSERKHFINCNLGYSPNNLRNDISRPRETNPPESEYKRNSNSILNSQDNSERNNFINYNLGYRHNNLRNDISGPRETNPPESEYERNSNVLNSQYNSERNNFINYNLGHRHNNLRNDISRPRETNPPESEYERNSNVLNSQYNSERNNFINYNLGHRHNDLRNDISRPRETNPRESEYERNSNVLNSQHNSERKKVINYNRGYRHNNSRNDINRPRKIHSPALFERSEDIFTSTPKWSNPREGNSHIKRINSRQNPSERSIERPFYGSQSARSTQKIPNLDFPSTSFEYRKNFKINKLPSAIATRTVVDQRSDIETNKQSKNETIETQNDFKVSSKNDKVVSKNKKLKNRNGRECELVCPHCNLKYFDSHQYISHLSSQSHSRNLEKVVSKRSTSLKKIRIKQRIEQNILDENADDLESSTNVCHICRLNYKQSEDTHKASKYHMLIKDFLEQYCEICNINLNNHVGYVSHICSIGHLKRMQKQNIDEENREAEDVVIDKSKKIVGREKVCKVEAYYCKLCKIHLPRVNNDRIEEVISVHCSEQFHLEQYYNYRKNNNCFNGDEVVAKQEDLKKEEIVDDELNKCIDEDELRDEKELQPKEKATGEYEEILVGVENSENKDDMNKLCFQKEDVCINQDESTIQENKSNDNSYCNNEQFFITEQSVLKKEVPVKVDNNSEKLENSENKIVDEINKSNLQEDVNIDDHGESNMRKFIQDLTNIPEEAEKDKDEYSQSESEPC